MCSIMKGRGSCTVYISDSFRDLVLYIVFVLNLMEVVLLGRWKDLMFSLCHLLHIILPSLPLLGSELYILLRCILRIFICMIKANVVHCKAGPWPWWLNSLIYKQNVSDMPTFFFSVCRRAGGERIYGVFDNQFPAALKKLPFDRHLSLQNVRKIVSEADGYQPHLIAPEQGYRRLIESALMYFRGPAEAVVDAVRISQLFYVHLKRLEENGAIHLEG